MLLLTNYCKNRTIYHLYGVKKIKDSYSRTIIRSNYSKLPSQYQNSAITSEILFLFVLTITLGQGFKLKNDKSIIAIPKFDVQCILRQNLPLQGNVRVIYLAGSAPEKSVTLFIAQKMLFHYRLHGIQNNWL